MNLETGTLEITGLRFETLQALKDKAREAGKTVEEYLRTVIEADVLADQSFSEILEPIRRSFDESGMSETELDTLLLQARQAALHAPAQPQLSPSEKATALRQWVAGLDRNTPLLSDGAISRASIYVSEDAER